MPGFEFLPTALGDEDGLALRGTEERLEVGSRGGHDLENRQERDRDQHLVGTTNSSEHVLSFSVAGAHVTTMPAATSGGLHWRAQRTAGQIHRINRLMPRRPFCATLAGRHCETKRVEPFSEGARTGPGAYGGNSPPSSSAVMSPSIFHADRVEEGRSNHLLSGSELPGLDNHVRADRNRQTGDDILQGVDRRCSQR